MRKIQTSFPGAFTNVSKTEAVNGNGQLFLNDRKAGKLKVADRCLLNRLRYCIWKDWKNPERKRENLICLEVNPDDANAWSRTLMGGWAVAQSPILLTTITINRLKQRGYMPMLDVYYKLNPSLCESARRRICENRPPRRMRNSPCRNLPAGRATRL